MKKIFILLLFSQLACVPLMIATSDLSQEFNRVEYAKLARPDYEDRDKTGWLGFDYVLDESWGRVEAKITKVYPDSPAAQAGLNPGDVIIMVEAYGVPEFEALTDPDTGKRVAGAFVGPPKTKVKIFYEKDGDKTKDVTVILKMIKRPEKDSLK